MPKKIYIRLLFLLFIFSAFFSFIFADNNDLTLYYVDQRTLVSTFTTLPVNTDTTVSFSPKVEKLFSLDYGKTVLDDTRYVFTSPFRWETKEWIEASLMSLAIVGTAAYLDKPIHDQVQNNRNNTTDNIANIFEPFGAEYSLGILGAYYVAGMAFDDTKAKTIALDGISASFIASGIITPILKEIVGRSRPSQNQGTYNFQPFSGNASFPSGHATQAFAVASVIAEHNDALWIKAVSYGTASMVGYARIEQNAHYASDVLAGAAIGTFVGRAVVHRNEKKRNEISLQPYFNGDSRGLMLSCSF